MKIDKCRACPMEIIFLYQANAEGERISTKANPIEANPHPKGNLVIDREKGIYRFATPNEKEVAQLTGKNLYVSHFAYCPNRGKFKGDK